MNIENKKKILLVEDEAILALSEKKTLEKYGYEVVIAHSGEKAVETFKENPDIDLILMDIDLGKGIDGTETAAKILKDNDLPVVFLSSHMEPEIVEKTEKITSYGYVVKDSSGTVLDASIKMAFKLFDAHQNIKDNERRFRAIFDATFQFTGLLSPDGILVETNQASLDFAGLTRQEVVGKPLWETLWWAADEDRVNKLKDAILKAARGIFVRYEVELQGAGHDILNIDFSLKSLFDIYGNVIMLISEGRDITDRKQAEDSLRLRESYLSAIIENQPGLLWLKDRDGKFLAVNKQFSDSCGLAYPDLLVGRTDLDIWPCELAVRYIADDARVIKSEKPYMVEEPISDRGKIDWFETFKAPIFDKQGKVIGTTGYSRNITERKQVEELLREGEERFRKIFEEGQIGIAILNSNFKFEKVNQAFCRFTGYSPEELVSMTFVDITHKDHIVQDVENIKKLMRKEISYYKTEKRYIHKTGETVWGKVSVSIVRDKDENFLYYLTMLDDMTERKCAEEKIAALLSEKDFIIKEVHHRIKNNMSTIQSLLTLQAGTLKDPSASAALRDAGSRVYSMMLLYDKLYMSSSLNDIAIKSYLPFLVDEIIANFPGSALVTVVKKIDDFVVGIKKMHPLGIIINELLTNIMKYAFADKADGLIVVEAVLKPGPTENENIVSVAVTDNGKGMSESISFQNSTGFGLVLVRALTRQLEGTIRIERTNGTRIILEFPVL